MVELTGLDGYGTQDIAPIDGKVYLWLPNGMHVFTIDGVKYRADVEDAATTAVLASMVAFVLGEGGHCEC